jgi:hypothetical protein
MFSTLLKVFLEAEVAHECVITLAVAL